MTSALVAFALAAAVLVLLPGPDSMLMLRAIATSGRAGAVRTAAGILTGLTLWVGAASIGLAALLKASQLGYTALRLVGAGYLLLLGLETLGLTRRARFRLGRSGGIPGPSSRRRGLLGTGYAAGLACDLFNPKVGVFFVTFLPGFVPAGSSVAATSLLFGGVFVALTAAYFAVMLVAVERLTRWLHDNAIRRRIEWLSGTVLIAFGVRLATEG